MKVLFVHDRFGALGGAEANISVASAELKEREHTVGLLHGFPTGSGEEEWREIFGAHCFPLTAGDHRTQAAAAVHSFQPDVIYIHKMADLAVLETLTEAGVPIIRMVHDHEMYCMKGYKYNSFSRRICARPASLWCVFPCGATVARKPKGGLPFTWVSYAAKKAEIRLNRQFDRLIVASEYMRDELLRNGFAPDRIDLLAPVPPPVGNEERSTFSDRNVILYAGQIIRGKGVDVLLESLARLAVPFECRLLGDGSHRPYCEALSRKLGLQDRVQFRGFVPHGDLAEHFRDASVMAMSSVWPEPFGAVGLEGMRFGLPVVAFDAGGIKEWLIDRHNGFLVPWMDRAAYAERLETLLRDKKLARLMGERGYHLARKRYDLSHYITNLERLFARLVPETELQTAP